MTLDFDIDKLKELRRAEIRNPGNDEAHKALCDFLLVNTKWSTTTVHQVAPMARAMGDLAIRLDEVIARMKVIEDVLTEPVAKE